MELTIQNCVEFVRNSTPEAVREAVRETYAAETEAKEALRAKCAAYFDGKKQRFQRIEAQVEKIQEQRQAVEAEKARHDRGMVEATISGDDVTITAIQKELERCASALSSFTAQIEMFQGYEITGDPALYAEIAQDHAALQELISANAQIRDALFAETEKNKNAWARAVYNPDTYGHGITGYREPWMADFDRVQEDQQKAPETVGAKLDAAAADAKTAAARQQGAAAPRAVFPGH